jgi:hypothetical protein
MHRIPITKSISLIPRLDSKIKMQYIFFWQYFGGIKTHLFLFKTLAHWTKLQNEIKTASSMDEMFDIASKPNF